MEYILSSNTYIDFNCDPMELPSKLTILGTNIATLKPTATVLSTAVRPFKNNEGFGIPGLHSNSSRDLSLNSRTDLCALNSHSVLVLELGSGPVVNV